MIVDHFDGFHAAVGRALPLFKRECPYIIAQVVSPADYELVLQEYFNLAYVTIKRAYSFQVFGVYLNGNMSEASGYVVGYYSKEGTMLGAYARALS